MDLTLLEFIYNHIIFYYSKKLMKINENNDKSFQSNSIKKASSMLSMIEDVNNQ